MLTPENARWCAVALATVVTVAVLLACWLDRRDRVNRKGGAR